MTPRMTTPHSALKRPYAPSTIQVPWESCWAAANKVKGARCALAWSPETARLAREHNNAQLIGIGGRMHSQEEALEIVDAFLDQEWSRAERHQRRIDILAEYERTNIPPELPKDPR